MFSFDALLSDNIVEHLSSVGPVKTRQDLSAIIAGQWGWEYIYGDELYLKLSTIDIPEPSCSQSNTKTRLTKGVKRRVDVAEGGVRAEKRRKQRTMSTLLPQQPGELVLGLDLEPITPENIAQ
ncbi:hypothetical protein M378DRAFT_7777 [Amanita muscaria Koide BX008]|uniref:Uncharacterized protein n=1 Tax=Amanita muscaria (strain Koide BX008) TaxID=946122 RepID=A0A0C2TRY0_AMAMK|nr:hypothetical protein M378DRAFT_7777 [Amanita muscaria Koide BX008]